MKAKKAISLIVFVITVIILSILAATVIVSISNTNVIEEGKEATFKSDMASYKEIFELYVTGKLAEDETFDRTSLDSENLEEIVGKIEEKYKEGLKIQDGKLVFITGNETEKEIAKNLGMEPDPIAGIIIPDEFHYVDGTKDTGLVIEDSYGNQFVWVPVEYTKEEGETPIAYTCTYTKADGTTEEKTTYLYNSFTKVFKRGTAVEQEDGTYKMTGDVEAKYTEPYSYNGVTGYLNEIAEYYEMCESVQEYGGFYIARFEAGDGKATSDRDKDSGVSTVVSKKGAVVYNYVPWGTSMKEIGETGAVYLSKKMATDYGYTSVVSTLCYSVQWDAVMNFVSDANHNITDLSSWGNHVDYWGENTGAVKLYTCGSNEDWKAKNIYDLAGNVWEWTMEARSTYGRCVRGSNWKSTEADHSASVRANNVPNYETASGGFRPTLYIK